MRGIMRHWTVLSRHGNKPARYDSYVIHYDFHFANCFNDCHCVFTDCETFKRTIPFVAATVILRLVTSNKRMIKYSPLSPPPPRLFTYRIIVFLWNRRQLEFDRSSAKQTLKFLHFPRSLLNAKLIKRRESDNINLVVLFVSIETWGGGLYSAKVFIGLARLKTDTRG